MVNKTQYFIWATTFLAGIVFFAYENTNSLFNDNAILLLTCAFMAVSSRVTFNETTITKEMGKASYSLFLVHTPIQIIGFRILKIIEDRLHLPELALWGIWFTMIAFSIAVAFMFQKYVDKPLSQITTKLLKRNHKVAVA